MSVIIKKYLRFWISTLILVYYHIFHIITFHIIIFHIINQAVFLKTCIVELNELLHRVQRPKKHIVPLLKSDLSHFCIKSNMY